MSDLTDLLRATADDRLPDKRDRLYDLADRLDAEMSTAKAAAWAEGFDRGDTYGQSRSTVANRLLLRNPYKEGS